MRAWRAPGGLPAGPLPPLDGYLDCWSDLHGGYDPRSNRLARAWLAGTYHAARPLARLGVRPAEVTVTGVLMSAAALRPAAARRRWPLVAAAGVLGAAALDNLDGGVAILAGRTSRFGALLDSAADRMSDGLLMGALVAAGAPRTFAVAGAGAVLGLEYTRALARAVGFSDIGVVTVGERPTRVIVTIAGLACAGLFPGRAAACATGATVALTGLSVAGQVQLLAVLRRAPA